MGWRPLPTRPKPSKIGRLSSPEISTAGGRNVSIVIGKACDRACPDKRTIAERSQRAVSNPPELVAPSLHQLSDSDEWTLVSLFGRGDFSLARSGDTVRANLRNSDNHAGT